MIDTIRSLLAIGLHPKRQIQELWAHEQAEKQRYRSTAFHFLTLDTATGRLLAVLGTECEARLTGLESFASTMDMPKPQCEGVTRSLTSLAHDDEPITVARRQFSKTIAAAKRAQHFYEAMCESNCTLALQAFLHDGFHQKRAEHRLLLEHFDTLRLETLRLPASTSSSPNS
ncbi:hypothetical protein [Halomonas sp. I5-271120]|uniref:hypothetical protein n=1 Tax=Halomonas sp. I5-271120 TaxID=3061632 RepID=UPI00271492F5|nr:hypothetical protein [Halomonas sp. I5-271120]